MRLIARLWSWVKGLFGGGPAPFTTIRVEEPPEVLRSRTVYLLGEGEHIWSVAMLCPCGCGEQIQLSTLDSRPRWSVEIEGDGSVTLSPSVWRTVGCRSHFFLRSGLVLWCTGSVTT